jgi:surfactin synthase thioesterase subunit
MNKKQTFFQQIFAIFGHKLVATMAHRVAVWGHDSGVAPWAMFWGGSTPFLRHEVHSFVE